MLRVVMTTKMALQVNKDVNSDKTSEADEMNLETNSKRRGDAYLNEQSVIFDEETVGGEKGWNLRLSTNCHHVTDGQTRRS